jgi:DNA (cytosine-5)-methyltransferase 1
VKVFWIDLFSGAGGTSSGIHLANEGAKVVACVNHDAVAIESHRQNHPFCKHFVEDIRDFNVVLKLKVLVDELRIKYPGCYINIWASLECTNYSKAKGGLPRDADSRTLANSLFMYLKELNPDYLYIENVREFMSWGPLDCNGRPVSTKAGVDYLEWVNIVKTYGFAYSSKILNAADFGAYTSRSRYFGIFGKTGLPRVFPEPTHRNPKKFPNSVLPKWKAVKEVLDMEDKGLSVFERKKDLADATFLRLHAGLKKFARKEEGFIKRYNGGDPDNKVTSLDTVIGAISTNGRHAVVQPEFLTSYYGNGQAHDINEPCPTVTTKDRFALNFLLYSYSKFTASSVDDPAGTVTTTPKHNLVNTEWITDTQYGRVGQHTDVPMFTLIARMDKKPPYIVNTTSGIPKHPINGTETHAVWLVKHFMRVHGIYDLKMRMLHVLELKRIQGFDENYILTGTKTDQKKHIGNAVEVHQATAIINANYESLLTYKLTG